MLTRQQCLAANGALAMAGPALGTGKLTVAPPMLGCARCAVELAKVADSAKRAAIRSVDLAGVLAEFRGFAASRATPARDGPDGRTVSFDLAGKRRCRR